MEGVGRGDGVLTGHGVDDEEGVVRLDPLGDLADLLHHLGVDGQAAGGVDDDDVAPEAPGLGHAPARGGDRITGLGEDRDIDLAAERAELLDGGGTLEVGADEQRVAALLLEPAGQLGRVRRLARALQSRHQYDRGRPGGVRDLEGLAPEGVHQLLVDDLDDLLAGVQNLRPGEADGLLADALDDGAGHAHVDVGLEEGATDLP